MLKYLKKSLLITLVLLQVAALNMGFIGTASAGSVVSSYDIVKSDYPDIINRLVAGGATEEGIKNFLADLEAQVGKPDEENFDKAMYHAIKDVITWPEHRDVLIALLDQFSEEIDYLNTYKELPPSLVGLRDAVKRAVYTTAGGGGGGTKGTGAVYSTNGSGTVDPDSGGTISLNGNASIEIPAGALRGSSPLEVVIVEVTSPPSTPSGYRILGKTYDIKVDGSGTYNFNSSVTLTFTFDPGALNSGEVPAIEKYDTAVGAWVSLGGIVSGNTISVVSDHLCNFAVMVKTNEEKPPVKQPNVTLTDISGHWAANDINTMLDLGLVAGVSSTQFAPERSISRAEFAALLVQALKLPAGGQLKGHFNDVAVDQWYYGPVNAAAEAGLVSGYTGGIFNPAELITREQMACMISSALNYKGIGSQPNTAQIDAMLGSYQDDNSISSWARGSVARAVQENVLKGRKNNLFAPSAYATRAEATVMVLRVYELIN